MPTDYSWTFWLGMAVFLSVGVGTGVVAAIKYGTAPALLIVGCGAIAIGVYSASKWDRATRKTPSGVDADYDTVQRLRAQGLEGPYLKQRNAWMAASPGQRWHWRAARGGFSAGAVVVGGVPGALALRRGRQRHSESQWNQ